MKAYYGSRISENQTVTPEGFLICMNVPIARIGTQQYLRYELGLLDGDPNALIDVMRSEDEVFSAATIASFEGKPVTDDHPPVSVTAENVVAYDNGHTQNVRRGQGTESDLLIADLFITSRRLINDIKHGRREVSCGYDCEYAQDENGHIFQRSIRGNHVAVVPAGRAGSRVAIKDSTQEPTKSNERGKKSMDNKKKSLISRLFTHAVKDMEPDEVADTIEEISTNSTSSANSDKEQTETSAVKSNTETAKDNGEIMQQILAAIAALGEQFKAFASAPKDEAPSPETAPDPLDALVQEIAQRQAETPSDQEAAETIPADELPGETHDEDGPVAESATLPENPIPGADRAVLAVISAIKPVIAALPDKERKSASDRAASEIRKLLGKDAQAKTNGYAGIMGVMQQSAKKQSKDASPKADDGTIGRTIMAARNPHYKAKA